MKNIFTITESAKNQIKFIIVDDPFKILKISVNSGGCSGFTYAMDLINEDEIQNNDEFVEEKIIIDGTSVMFLIGTELDYVTEILGSRFVFNNPMATSQCGCKTSFNI